MSTSEQPNQSKQRIVSVDALRGFDMFWIIGGGEFIHSLVGLSSHQTAKRIQDQLEHVEWRGFNFEDLIYPLFMFIMGVVLPFSISRRRERGESLKTIHFHIVKRSVVLVLLGLIYNGLLRFDWPKTRWPGVLQRIGICYFFAAMLAVHTKWRTQVIIICAVLLLYWAVTMLVPVPGFDAGDLTMEGCLSSYIDQKLIPGVLYYTYGDNEGVISTFPAVCTVLMGVLAGHWLRSERSSGQKVVGLAVAGFACTAVGWLWGLVFPIIKIIWTSSYTLYSGGMCLMLLALFYWIIDIKGFKKWAFFFIVIGMNPITIYFLQGVVNFEEISAFFLGGLAAHLGPFGPVILPLGALAASWLLLWFLHRHKIFFKV